MSGSGAAHVVEPRSVRRIGEHAAVESAADDDGDAFPDAEREQPCVRGLVEERVATGEQDAVGSGLGDDSGEAARVAHSRADRPDDPFVAELRESGQRLRDRLVEVIVGVVDEHEVDPVETEAFEAFLERTADAVSAEVEDGSQLRGCAPHAGREALTASRALTKQAADLRRDGDHARWRFTEHGADAPL